MQIRELLQEYPKATEVVREWFINKMKESGDNIPEDFVEQISEKIDGMIESTIENSPHSLFEIFDNYEIYIKIDIAGNNIDNNMIFTYTILPKDKDNTVLYSSKIRKEAEGAAVKDAFKLLNEKL